MCVDTAALTPHFQARDDLNQSIRLNWSAENPRAHAFTLHNQVVISLLVGNGKRYKRAQNEARKN